MIQEAGENVRQRLIRCALERSVDVEGLRVCFVAGTPVATVERAVILHPDERVAVNIDTFDFGTPARTRVSSSPTRRSCASISSFCATVDEVVLSNASSLSSAELSTFFSS